VGLNTQNSRAFLMPILIHRRQLLERGIEVHRYQAAAPELAECDLLMLDSKVHRGCWATDGARALAEIEAYSEAIDAVLFCDTGDSTGMLQAQVLPYVTGYLKTQLLHDRRRYLKPFYGGRTFTDHYHNSAGIIDKTTLYSIPVSTEADLAKLGVSWHMGMANHGLWGPKLTALYERLGLGPLLRFPRRFVAPGLNRPQTLSCRIGIAYDRETVRHQRARSSELLSHLISMKRVSRRTFFRELAQSKAVFSPFGWGEVAIRDFETFLAGALLLKPDMSHMETWPNLYRDGETMVAISWDLDDLQAKLEDVTNNYGDYLDIARSGQQAYKNHLVGKAAAEAFCARFETIVRSALHSVN